MSDNGLASRLLDETRHEIDRADSKASILVGSAFVAASLFVGSMISGDLDPRQARGATQVLLGLTAVALAVAIAKLGQVVYPRTTNPSSGGADYFADHAAAGSAEKLGVELRKLDAFDRDTRQLFVLGGIAEEKYTCLKWGIGAGAASMVLAVATAASEMAL